MKQWEEIKQEFDSDGTLRDIYVEFVDTKVWDRFIGAVIDSKYQYNFFHGENEIITPQNFNDIKWLQQTDPTIFQIWINEKIQLNCHFFIESEIELDLLPKAIGSESDYKELIEFLEWLTLIVDKTVKLTHENSQDRVILEVLKT